MINKLAIFDNETVQFSKMVKYTKKSSQALMPLH